VTAASPYGYGFLPTYGAALSNIYGGYGLGGYGGYGGGYNGYGAAIGAAAAYGETPVGYAVVCVLSIPVLY
jgi:hypothetical protein